MAQEPEAIDSDLEAPPIAVYWSAYGGARALVTSPYLAASLLLSGVYFRLWSQEPWWDLALATLPNLLGFSLGGFALWMAIGSNEFRRALTTTATEGSKTSLFMVVNAAFVHFLLVQVIAILAALFALNMNFSISESSFLRSTLGSFFHYFVGFGSYLGFSTFIYALLTGWAAVLAIFEVASAYDLYSQSEGGADHTTADAKTSDRTVSSAPKG